MQRLYWLFADPLWSRPGNESRIEYFARVAFAEFRWTVEEMGIRGADTDRGNIHIRYGPPDVHALLGPSAADGVSDITTLWIYNNGLMFAFTGTPTFATARTAPGDVAMVNSITHAAPVRWDNLAATIPDTMRSSVTRFRGGRDSVDVFVAADAVPASMRRFATSASPMRADVWLITANAAVVYRDSARLEAPQVRSWSRRVPAGVYIFRAEATTPDTAQSARTTTIIDASLSASSGIGARGIALSDLLLASSVEPGAGTGRRWSDLSVVPIVDALPRNASLALVWENYEFSAKDGMAQYDVVILLTRERSAVGRIAAQVVGGLASAARVDRRGDEVAISFERSMAHAPAFADHISVSLQDTPPGKYQVTVQVTDRVSKQMVSRSRNFVIQD
jgi:GWxTD domain-containing protein